jgi:glycosyltransferase involved in cell wall biosynthesis
MSTPGRRLRIAILCEYGTVTGGEHSLLAAMGHLRDRVDASFLAPPQGRLNALLAAHHWPLIPFDLRDADHQRRDASLAEDELIARVQQLQADLLHANSLSMGRLTGRVAHRLPCPTTTHLRDIIGLSRAAMIDLARNRRLLAVSRATRDFHVAQGLPAERVHVLYNGVDSERFRPASSAEEILELRHRLGLPATAKLVLTIGQIGLRKGFDVLAAAAGEIAAHVPDLCLLLVGERSSSKAETIAFEAALKSRLGAVLPTDRVHWLGHREDVPELLRAADLLIHPARQEPFGRVLLEAAASSLAILATAVGGTSELLVDGESARLIPPDDPALMAQAAVELLRDDRLRKRFGAKARQTIESRFGTAASADQLLAAWQAVCAGTTLDPKPGAEAYAD